MPSIDTVWNRIAAHAGEPFHQKRGGRFTYVVDGNRVIPDRTNHSFQRSQFQQALERVPLNGPGQLQDLRGPSYLYAILMDDRIRSGEW